MSVAKKSNWDFVYKRLEDKCKSPSATRKNNWETFTIISGLHVNSRHFIIRICANHVLQDRFNLFDERKPISYSGTKMPFRQIDVQIEFF